MKLNKKWTAIISMLITALTILGGGELTDTIDVGGETECPILDCPITICQETGCPDFSIAYINNCKTGETDKYMCNEKGECKSTDEILSELG